METELRFGTLATCLSQSRTSTVLAVARLHSSWVLCSSFHSYPSMLLETSLQVASMLQAFSRSTSTCVEGHTSLLPSRFFPIHGSNSRPIRRKSLESACRIIILTLDRFLAVLSAYAVFLGPMIGLLCVHYYIIQRRVFVVPDLYEGSSKSLYWYRWGTNWRTAAAWVLAVVPSMPGFVASVNSSVTIGVAASRIFSLSFLLGFTLCESPAAYPPSRVSNRA